MKSPLSAWILYNIIVCFAVYWLSNLILWYPWSVSETWGQILMLTVNPVLWGIASYRCIIRYPGSNLLQGIFYQSLFFTLEAISSDLVFFVVIRNAKDKLFHITTLYAWGFVLFLPFIIYFLFRKQVLQNKKQLRTVDFRMPIAIGVISFVLITVIILFGLNFIK